MSLAVEFQDESLAIDVGGDRLVAAWSGPASIETAEIPGLFAAALETPADFPPLRQSVVPGDRVVIAVDPDVPGLGAAIQCVVGVLESAGVEADSITVLATGAGAENLRKLGRYTFAVHDPADREQLAYLAATQSGRRIYLNRLVVDADFVLPIGRLGFDAAAGYCGPWTTLFPGMSDAAARAEQLNQPTATPDPEKPSAALAESAEVAWLIGNQFQVGVLPAVTGVASVLAGLNESVRTVGVKAVDAAWRFRAPSTADLVIAGVGTPGRPTSIADLAAALTNAARLVRPGGKIAALSRAGGEIGPALQVLAEAGEPRLGLQAMRKHEDLEDAAEARSIAEALVHADIYLYSALDAGLVEDLSFVALGRPEEARRLAAAAQDVILFSHADRSFAEVGTGLDAGGES